MARKDRMKASELFNKSNPFFAKKVSFEEAFPKIEDVKIVVEEDGKDVRDWNRKSHYGRDVGEFIDCSNLICYGGGFSIGSILRDMVRENKTHAEERKFCKGYEGSPKGRDKYRDCINSFKVTVDIIYKEG